MKQHITVKQVQELSSLQIDKLIDIGIVANVNFFNRDTWIDIAKALTIGKMIEILSDRLWRVDHPWSAKTYEESHKFRVWIYKHKQPSFSDRKSFVREELVDALWKSCVYVLTNQ